MSNSDSIPDVLAFFNLGIPLSVEPVKSGISNPNYFVKTPEGDYVIKFLMNQNVATIENDLHIQKCLQKVHIPSPIYLEGKDGQYIFANEKISAVVSKRIAGISPKNISKNLAFDYGCKLAGFHTNVTSLPHENSKGLINPYVSGINSVIFSLNLPEGIVHGDFHSGNALVDCKNGDKIVAILDFEEAGSNLLLIDLAVTVMGVCSYKDNAMDEALIKSCISGYETIRKLTPLEKENFTEACDYAAKTWIKWFKENNYQKYADRHSIRLDTFLKLELNLV